jgi:hypothetical protein
VRADGKDIVALARSPEHLLEISDVVIRLLAATAVYTVILGGISGSWDTALINAPTLAYLMERCRSLKVLTLEDLEMDEDHCRLLGVHSRPGLEIELHLCELANAGASALAEVLGRNQGPTNLGDCFLYSNYFVLMNGLRGNSRLKSLSPCWRPQRKQRGLDEI